MRILFFMVVLVFMLAGENRALKCGTGLWPYEVVDGIQIVWVFGTVGFIDGERLNIATGGGELFDMYGGVDAKIDEITAYATDDNLLYLEFEDFDHNLFHAKIDHVWLGYTEFSIQKANRGDARPYLSDGDWLGTTLGSCLYGGLWYLTRWIGWSMVALLGFGVFRKWRSLKKAKDSWE